MKNETQCKQFCATTGNTALAGFLPVAEEAEANVSALLTPAEELRLVRQAGIRAFASEKTAWLWLAASALTILGLCFLG
jgi:hypothetical protein